MCGKSFLRSLWIFTDRYVPVFHTKSGLLKATRGIYIQSNSLSCPDSSADFNAGIGLVQMMGTTNYLALVGGGRSPKFAMNKVHWVLNHTMTMTNRSPGYHLG